VNVTGIPKAQLLITLEAFLIDQASQGMRCLLVVDEAQNLSPRAVEELRMLSNYQLGTQALLQSFLVGQPEFKRILQRPEMEQLRQRVAATCHIGPMDFDDTQHYIEHRLKCAGAMNGTPFSADAIGLIFKASKGIPRRINSLCDRLLLAGFLATRKSIGAEDVNEVVEELAVEGTMGTPTSRNREPASEPMPADLDVSRLLLDAGSADAISQHLGSLAELQQGDRLQRLELSLLRLEHVNLETLETLKKLINAVRKPPAGEAS
jgi:hypothetical protein